MKLDSFKQGIETVVCKAGRSIVQSWVWRKHEKYSFSPCPHPPPCQIITAMFPEKLHFEWELQGKLWHTCYTTYTTPVGARVKLLLFSFSKKSAVWWQWRAEECDSPPRPLTACRGRLSETRTPPLHTVLYSTGIIVGMTLLRSCYGTVKS